MVDIHKVTPMCYSLEKSTHLQSGGNSDLIVPIEYSKDDGIVTPMTMVVI